MNKRAAWNKRAIYIAGAMIILALIGLVLILTSLLEFSGLEADRWKEYLILGIGIASVGISIITIVTIALLAKRRDRY